MKRIVSVLLILIICILPVWSLALAEPLGFGFVNARDVALRDTADRICRKLDELLVGKLWPTLRLPQAASLAMGTTA